MDVDADVDVDVDMVVDGDGDGDVDALAAAVADLAIKDMNDTRILLRRAFLWAGIAAGATAVWIALAGTVAVVVAERAVSHSAPAATGVGGGAATTAPAKGRAGGPATVPGG